MKLDLSEGGIIKLFGVVMLLALVIIIIYEAKGGMGGQGSSISTSAILIIKTTSSASSSTITSITTSRTTSSTTSSTTTTIIPDALKIGNASYDAFDLMILAAAAKYNLDPMVLKSQISLESSFNSLAASAGDPCGQLIQNGTDVGHSYGLLQLTPVCTPWFARNPNGSIDLSTNKSSTEWKDSAFNSTYNIFSGAEALSDNLQQVRTDFHGCTQDQYIYMSLSAYNSGMQSVTGCTSYNQRGTNYVNGVLNWYSRFSTMSGWPDSYAFSV